MNDFDLSAGVRKLPVHERDALITNIRRNWYLPVSALALFGLLARDPLTSAIGLPIAWLLLVAVTSQISSLPAYEKRCSFFVKIISLTTAIGICQFDYLNRLRWEAPSWLKIPYINEICGIILTAAAFIFVYFCLLLLWNKLIGVFSECKTFEDVKPAEWVFYGLLFVVFWGWMVVVFLRSNAFYGVNYVYDIIYTSDSGPLVESNVYLSLLHAENDLRQPLFAVFAAPFAGIPYFIGCLIAASATTQAILTNTVQLILLFLSNFILTKMMRLDATKRACFMLLSCCTYTQFLFTVMMEQYIVGYFWLIMCIYVILEAKQPSPFFLWGAGGTLLTSMILLPFVPRKSPLRQFREWFADMVKYGGGFVLLMLAFFRFDVFYTLEQKYHRLLGYSGVGLTFGDKLRQYTFFLRNYFLAPAAGVDFAAHEYASWQLAPITSMSVIGIMIFILALVSAVWNRNKKSCCAACGWVAFSVCILLVLGWGTKENGLILYALYFGWHFCCCCLNLLQR